MELFFRPLGIDLDSADMDEYYYLLAGATKIFDTITDSIAYSINKAFQKDDKNKRGK